jgi:hypothetical protein
VRCSNTRVGVECISALDAWQVSFRRYIYTHFKLDLTSNEDMSHLNSKHAMRTYASKAKMNVIVFPML